MTEARSTRPAMPGPVEESIRRIDLAMDSLDFSTARRLASGVCDRDGQDAPLEAVALATLRLAGCDFATSQLRRARDAARRAALLLERTSLRSEEIDALSLAARVAALQGRFVEAVELARLSVLVSGDVGPGLHTVRAEMSLGAALAWAGATAQARVAFETAAHAASRHAGLVPRLEVAVDSLWCEALRPRDAEPMDPGSTDRRTDELQALLARWDGESTDTELVPGARASLRLSAAVALGFTLLRTGRPSEVASLLEAADAHPVSAAPLSWLACARSWLMAELARDAGDDRAAAMHAAKLCASAGDIDVPLLALRGYALAAEIAQAMGRSDEASRHRGAELALHQRLMVRQLESRDKMAEALWAARQSQQRIQTLAEESTTYWKWAHEDALTGIANLRRFNQCMTEWTAATQDARQPLFVAVIDVDRFKSINDSFSHEVGDLVLKEVARQMSLLVRESDLPARWGGDEFAILFREVDLASAQAVGDRLQRTVRDHDWSTVRPGLKVGISIGVVEARRGESKLDIRDRADKAMYDQKRERRRAEMAQHLPSRSWDRATDWLRSAKRVVVFVGSAGAVEPGRQVLGSVMARRPFALANEHQPSLWTPEEVREAWKPWRRESQGASIPMAVSTLPQLAALVPEVRFITERIDDSLTKAGVHGAIELYGNGFRDRCSACGLVWPSEDGGHCLSCAAAIPTIRPDVVMPGEQFDARLHAAAELAMKRAEVILAVDCDGTITPSLGLFHKALNRDARIVAIGQCGRRLRELAHLVLDAPAAVVLEGLVDRLKLPPGGEQRVTISDAGFDIADFLSGRRTDDSGVDLERALAWKDHEIDLHQPTLAWLFPLPTLSRVNPWAPSPTDEDFVFLSRDDQVQAGMRRAFERMLRYYGFEWRDGKVLPLERDWEQGFSAWALTASAHDLFISRILGALRRVGLVGEAHAFLDALTPEVQRYRGPRASIPLGHWRREAGRTQDAVATS